MAQSDKTYFRTFNTLAVAHRTNQKSNLFSFLFAQIASNTFSVAISLALRNRRPKGGQPAKTD